MAGQDLSGGTTDYSTWGLPMLMTSMNRMFGTKRLTDYDNAFLAAILNRMNDTIVAQGKEIEQLKKEALDSKQRHGGASASI